MLLSFYGFYSWPVWTINNRQQLCKKQCAETTCSDKKFPIKFNRKWDDDRGYKKYENKQDETRPVEYHNCYPTSIEIQGCDLDDYTMKS